MRAAMMPDLGQARVKRQHRILLRLIPASLLPFMGAAIVAMRPPVWPVAGAPAVEWLDPFFSGAIVLALVGVFIASAWRSLKGWEASAPESPETAIREFYREAFSGRPNTRRMGHLLCNFDVAGPRVQPVFSWLTATAVPALDSPKAVARYWRALVRGDAELFRRLKVTGMEIEHPMPDVAIATVRLRVVVTHRLRSMLVLVAALLGGVAVVVLGAEWLGAHGVSYWTTVAAGLALTGGLATLLRKLLRAEVERREVAVRKLLVRSMYNWRLVSGEWETQDEADTSWLDPRELKV